MRGKLFNGTWATRQKWEMAREQPDKKVNPWYFMLCIIYFLWQSQSDIVINLDHVGHFPHWLLCIVITHCFILTILSLNTTCHKMTKWPKMTHISLPNIENAKFLCFWQLIVFDYFWNKLSGCSRANFRSHDNQIWRHMKKFTICTWACPLLHIMVTENTIHQS